MCKKHPLALFEFCPKCGSAEFVANDERSKRCNSCGFTYYLNASAATAAVIVNGRGEILVSRRAFEPARGTLDLPGGFVDPGETIDNGMQREIYEETGCRVKDMRWLFSMHNSYRYSGFDVPTADSIFLVHLVEGETPVASDDAESLEWIAIKDLKPEAFGLRSIRETVEKVKLLFAEGAL